MAVVGRLKLCLVFCSLAFVPVSGQQAVESTEGAKFTVDSLEKVKDLVGKKKAVVVDVRTKAEWDEAHLKIAQSIPMDRLRDPAKRAKAVKKLKKDKIVYVHCQHGIRAKICADVLIQMGYDARPLKVNYEDFGKAGFQEIEPIPESSRRPR